MVDNTINVKIDRDLIKDINQLIAKHLENKKSQNDPITVGDVINSIICMVLEQLMESGVPLNNCVDYLQNMIDAFIDAEVVENTDA